MSPLPLLALWGKKIANARLCAIVPECPLGVSLCAGAIKKMYLPFFLRKSLKIRSIYKMLFTQLLIFFKKCDIITMSCYNAK